MNKELEGTPVKDRPSCNIKVCCKIQTDNTVVKFETEEFEHKAEKIEFSFEELFLKMVKCKAFADYCIKKLYPCYHIKLIATGDYLVDINGEVLYNKWTPTIENKIAGTYPA